MSRAYVLLTVESGEEDTVLNELPKIRGVEESYFSFGVYDIIVKVKTESMEKLKEMVTSRIRSLDQVRSTLTLIIK
jgi:DNA-binding Lrp family transcriptional regulator